MTEWIHFRFSLPCIGEGNGNPLQCSCLENPRDGGAWWAAVYGVAQSQTRLKWLSSKRPLLLFWPISLFFFFILKGPVPLRMAHSYLNSTSLDHIASHISSLHHNLSSIADGYICLSRFHWLPLGPYLPHVQGQSLCSGSHLLLPFIPWSPG